ncbi:TIGR04104 family putative zinc finger protein [Ureibacillus manganicus]|uniref:Cxxc_20_cxxc protein n=1 Tax=Ureibacillus manganicus DSM 26584 TaxID=1384049 RepID=A0A0A3I659_9BACL|nr:hypothetical protein CD29_08315 [Ureibacillus manganicus DSM 26584]
MQKCGECNSSFSWSKIFKSYKWWAYKPIECDKCDTKHEITFFGRCTVVALTILPMQLFYSFLSPFDNIFITLGVGLLIAIVGFLLSPYCSLQREIVRKYT